MHKRIGWGLIMLTLCCALAAAVAAEEVTEETLVSPLEGYTPMSMPGEWYYAVDYDTLLGAEKNRYIELVNQDHLLDSRYKPKDLVNIRVRKTSYDPIQMRKEASEALTTLFEDAASQGITLYALSGYRSYSTQRTMYYNRLEAHNGVDDKAVAYPGASDHQTGLGADVINKGSIDAKLSTRFVGTKEALWLGAHSWEYGFVVRYPEDKKDITGIIYEPWHLRYVGLDVAAYIANNNLCLEEFTVEWEAEKAAYEGAPQG
ncbi:MAG: M15 family metallopeptidase [Oscillospiraceae bacterium]|jgi:D-alanyl-D-alanine carboxypeptidase|nr:M15 family metallopeptidase [Oscillospiraceae bacterium]